ncbi:MAG TPA: oxygenase MpaB family protein [Propionibacteriaceae bacterium]|nr:oxygenase MpaB family protein [Propionibacteriaceae bacterium]
MAIGILPNPRNSIAKAVRERVAGDFEAQHAEIWRPGERWFDERDAIWRVHGDTSMFIGGVRALLLQALHPVALHAVVEHAGFRRDFWGRFQRTSRYVALTTYGTVSDAERAIATVRAIHRRVHGTTPDGTPYSADDPHLLMWVHAAEVDSFLRAFEAFGADALTPAEADDYVRQTGFIAAQLGVIDPPTTVAELTATLESYRPELSGSGPAREASSLLLVRPPFTGFTRAGYHLLAASAVSILPSWARTQLLLPALPITERALIRPLGRSAMYTLRWALTDDLSESS